MTDKVFCTESWAVRMARKEADRDVLRSSERLAELISVLLISLFGIYFIWLQVNDAGFFTASFSDFDMVLFYATMFYGLVPALTRLAVGRRNVARPLDVIGSVLFIISGSYFLTHWAFDFSYFSVGLPESIRFIFAWITNEIAQDLLLIAVVISVFVLFWTITQYYSVRKELQKRASLKAEAAEPSDSP
jgi:hypothetical protein